VFCETLEARATNRPAELSKIHGRQRYSFMDYTLSQVLMEYSLLKQVLFNELQAASPLDHGDYLFIDAFFDNAANAAATEFSRLREEELQRYTNELKITNSDLERFTAVAAHDLRSPAATIVGFSEIILDRLEDPEARRHIETIRRTGNRIITLVDQLLSFAQIGKSKYSAKIVSLGQSVDAALENLAAQIHETAAEIKVGELPSVHGDHLLLLQLFQNLISNCLKFRRPDQPCQIEINSQDGNGYYVVTVRDNGLGFAPDLAEEIFEPFRRGDNARKISGSGLGLATAKRVMDLHGGIVTAEGNPGKGAVFTLQFPKLRDH
jgi:signal transduction histidine kinase